MEQSNDLSKLMQELIEALTNNTKATYLVRREIQTQNRTLQEYMDVLREITPTY